MIPVRLLVKVRGQTDEDSCHTIIHKNYTYSLTYCVEAIQAEAVLKQVDVNLAVTARRVL